MEMKDRGVSSARHGSVVLVTLLSCILLLVSCAPEPVSTYATATPVPSHTPILTSAPVSSPTPIPTWTPTPTATPTLPPTLDPAAVASIAAAGRARLEAAGVDPLCLRWEDTDGDGEAEWLGVYLQPGEPPELMAFILDGGDWYDLRPLTGEKYGLGAYPTCELEVRDVNADGQIEILIWGHAGASIDLLHIFVWDGATYMLLAPFEGEAGVRLENTDGDLADEVIVGYDHDAARDLVWEAVYTWDGANYGWTWERYAWRYLDRPHAYLTDTPQHVVISFYLAVDDRDLPGAYGLLSDSAQAAQPYGTWVFGYVATVAVEAGGVYEVGSDGDVANVVAQVRVYDNVDGRVFASLWDVKWTVVRTPDGWWLESVSAVLLDQQEVDYYR